MTTRWVGRSCRSFRWHRVALSRARRWLLLFGRVSIVFRSEPGDQIRLDDARGLVGWRVRVGTLLSVLVRPRLPGILHELYRDNALRSTIELTARQSRTVLEALEKLD